MIPKIADFSDKDHAQNHCASVVERSPRRMRRRSPAGGRFKLKASRSRRRLSRSGRLFGQAARCSRSHRRGEFHLQFVPSPLQRLEGEVHLVHPGTHLDRAEQHVGLENFCRMAVHLGAPPWMPSVVYDKEAAGRGVDLNVDLGIFIIQDADIASRRRVNPRWRRPRAAPWAADGRATPPDVGRPWASHRGSVRQNRRADNHAPA